MEITLNQLQSIPTTIAGHERCVDFINPLNTYLEKYGIATPARAAAFLAQIMHESGEFHYLTELASGDAYEGRRDLGNVNPGDGVRYKGRGLIQITGRANYAACGEALGQDLINHPERLATPDLATASACWFWSIRHLNDYADDGDFETITRRINGGLNGQDDRIMYLKRATDALAQPTGKDQECTA